MKVRGSSRLCAQKFKKLSYPTLFRAGEGEAIGVEEEKWYPASVTLVPLQVGCFLR